MKLRMLAPLTLVLFSQAFFRGELLYTLTGNFVHIYMLYVGIGLHFGI
jgi:hypothetical protein